MKSLTTRDLGSRPRKARAELTEAGEAVLTVRGKPFAVVVAVEKGFEEAFELVRSIRARRSLSRLALGVICSVPFVTAEAGRALELQGVGVVTAPSDRFVTVAAKQSLPVEAIVVPPRIVVAANQVLVDVDVSRLQRKLEAAMEEMRAIQEERRFQKTMEAVRPKSSSKRAFEPPQDDEEFRRARREVEAMSDLRDAQAKIASADVRAPSDGYVIEHLLRVGQSTRKRKPAVTFLPLSKTVLTVTIDQIAVDSLPSMREIVVVSVDDEKRRFRARVDSLVTTSADTAVYTLVPLELPFLFLDAECEVRLQPTG